MKLLMIGATGYIGGAVTRGLQSAGHVVVPLLRPRATATAPDAFGDILYGDLSEPASLRAALGQDFDGIVHAGAPLGDWAADTTAVRTLLEGLRPGGVFVYLSGTWVLGGADGDAILDDLGGAPAKLGGAGGVVA